jgi:hypothetical protein
MSLHLALCPQEDQLCGLSSKASPASGFPLGPANGSPGTLTRSKEQKKFPWLSPYGVAYGWLCLLTIDSSYSQSDTLDTFSFWVLIIFPSTSPFKLRDANASATINSGTYTSLFRFFISWWSFKIIPLLNLFLLEYVICFLLRFSCSNFTINSPQKIGLQNRILKLGSSYIQGTQW